MDGMKFGAAPFATWSPIQPPFESRNLVVSPVYLDAQNAEIRRCADARRFGPFRRLVTNPMDGMKFGAAPFATDSRRFDRFGCRNLVVSRVYLANLGILSFGPSPCRRPVTIPMDGTDSEATPFATDSRWYDLFGCRDLVVSRVCIS